jgi:hypothetical protein
MSQASLADSEASLGDEQERLDLALEISMLTPQVAETDALQKALLDSQREAVQRRGQVATPPQAGRSVKLEATPEKSKKRSRANVGGAGAMGVHRAFLDLTQPGGPATAIDLEPEPVGVGGGVDGGGGVAVAGDGDGVGGGGGVGGAAAGGAPQPVVSADGIDWPTLLKGLDAEQVKALQAVGQGHNVVLIGAGGCGKSLTLARIVELLLELKKKGAAGTPTHGARKVLEANLGTGPAGLADQTSPMTLAKMFGCMPGEAVKGQDIARKVRWCLGSTATVSRAMRSEDSHSKLAVP